MKALNPKIKGFLFFRYFCEVIHRRILSLVLFLTTIFNSKGQIHDTSNVSNFYSINLDTFFFQLALIDSIDIDTTISTIHNYISKDSLISFQSLGSPGLAFNDFDFSLRKRLFDNYQFNKNFDYFTDNKSLIVTKKWYTNVKYVLGSKKEQFLTVLHSQNIFEGLNASINYERLSAEGYLRRQNTKLSQFQFFPWFETKDKKYSTYASISIKDYLIEENGGISDDSISSDLTDLNLLEINLLNAQNRTKKFNSTLYQKLSFGSSIENKRIFKHSISHRINYSEENNSYTDSEPKDDFYSTTYYDTSTTNDVLKINNLNNILKYSFLFSRNNSISLYAINEISNIDQRSLDTLLDNSAAGAELMYQSNIFNVYLDGKYSISGTDEGNYLINSGLSFVFLNNFQFNLNYVNKLFYPDLMFRIFQSNHFSWYNYLNQIKANSFDFSVHSRIINTTAQFRFIDIKNYTYLNEVSQPKQFDNKINYFSFQIRNLIRAGNFGLESNGTWQMVNNDEIVNVPELSLSGILFYENKLFKNALHTKTGIEAHYITSFEGDRYMPPLRHFYLQNEIAVAGFTQLDFFINFKVKTARVFIKVQNITYEGNDSFYYTVPGYPMPGRVFKLGINWMFFD